MTLRILATGGTLDKHYDEIAGQLTFGVSHIADMLARARVTLPHVLQQLPLRDSLDMGDAERQQVLGACRAASESAVVIIHGTDTMCDTAALLGGAGLPQTVVLCGAMIPYEMVHSDALFNLGFACAAAQLLPHGVYIAMNGHVFTWDQVRKNRTDGIFEECGSDR